MATIEKEFSLNGLFGEWTNCKLFPTISNMITLIISCQVENTHTHTHTHIYIYVFFFFLNIFEWRLFNYKPTKFLLTKIGEEYINANKNSMV